MDSDTQNNANQAENTDGIDNIHAETTQTETSENSKPTNIIDVIGNGQLLKKVRTIYFDDHYVEFASNIFKMF